MLFSDAKPLCFFPRIWTQEESRSFSIYWSEARGHGELRPKPTEQELASFYRQDHYDAYLSGKTAFQFNDKNTIPHRVLTKVAYLFDKSAPDPLEKILKLSGPRPSVCDIGCGGGTFLESIKPLASRVVGIDPSPVSAKALTTRGIEFHAGTADVLPDGLDRLPFDVVTMFHSLEHARNVAQSLANANSIMKPGGLLVIEVPNMQCLGFTTYPEVWIHTDAGRHLQFFTRRSLESFCGEAEFSIIDCEFTGFTHQFLKARTSKMQAHWDILFGDGAVAPVAPRASLSTEAIRLARALFSPAEKRYDIIRVYARKN